MAKPMALFITGTAFYRMQCGRPGFDAWVGKILEKKMATHSSILGWRIPMDRGACRATVMGRKELDTTEQLSTIAGKYKRCTEQGMGEGRREELP